MTAITRRTSALQRLLFFSSPKDTRPSPILGSAGHGAWDESGAKALPHIANSRRVGTGSDSDSPSRSSYEEDERTPSTPDYRPSALRWPFLTGLLVILLALIAAMAFAMLTLPVNREELDFMSKRSVPRNDNRSSMTTESPTATPTATPTAAPSLTPPDVFTPPEAPTVSIPTVGWPTLGSNTVTTDSPTETTTTDSTTSYVPPENVPTLGDNTATETVGDGELTTTTEPPTFPTVSDGWPTLGSNTVASTPTSDDDDFPTITPMPTVGDGDWPSLGDNKVTESGPTATQSTDQGFYAPIGNNDQQPTGDGSPDKTQAEPEPTKFYLIEPSSANYGNVESTRTLADSHGEPTATVIHGLPIGNSILTDAQGEPTATLVQPETTVLTNSLGEATATLTPSQDGPVMMVVTTLTNSHGTPTATMAYSSTHDESTDGAYFDGASAIFTTTLTNAKGTPTATLGFFPGSSANENPSSEEGNTGAGVIKVNTTVYSINRAQYLTGLVLPTLLVTILVAIPIRAIDANARALRPWRQLASAPPGTGVPASASLLMPTRPGMTTITGAYALLDALGWGALTVLTLMFRSVKAWLPSLFSSSEGGRGQPTPVSGNHHKSRLPPIDPLSAITSLLSLAASLLIPFSAEAVNLDQRGKGDHGSCEGQGAGDARGCAMVLGVFQRAAIPTLVEPAGPSTVCEAGEGESGGRER